MHSRRALVALLVALAAAVLVAHSLVWNFVTDDAFISFVYSRNLARHGQLVFNLGERVEGYTNFLWTVILAGLMKLGLQPEIMSRLLGTSFAVATLGVCAFASRRARARDTWSAWDALPALLLCAVPGYACWSSGGLETQLFTFLITLGATLGAPHASSAVAFALAALTRPEGTLFFLLTAAYRGLGLIRRRQKPTGAELRWLGLFALGVVPHFFWRRWYYGWWLPNTFYIKSSAGIAAWAQGAYYLKQFVVQFHLWAVPLVVLVGLFRRREPGARALLGYVGMVAAVFLLYVASVGGDFMGLYRFAVPVLPLLALAAAAGLRLALDELRPLAQAGAVALLLVGHAWHAVRVDQKSLVVGADLGPAGNIDSPGYLRWYTADRAAIGRWFGRYAQPDDFADVGGAGAQVYYSGIPSLDCFGLSDEYIAHRVPATAARPGHQKYAPLEYELAKHPTIITSRFYFILGAPYQPPPAEARVWQERGYHYVSVEVPGLSSPWYSFLLRNDRRLGPLAPETRPDYELDGWRR